MPVMAKDSKTTPVSTRLNASQIAELDKAAEEQPFKPTRSVVVAQIIQEWIERRKKQARK